MKKDEELTRLAMLAIKGGQKLHVENGIGELVPVTFSANRRIHEPLKISLPRGFKKETPQSGNCQVA